MAKKGRKKLLSDKIAKIKGKKSEMTPSSSVTSRFELKFSKRKNEVLGKNSSKSATIGKPVQSKTRAFEKRCETLGEESENFGKSSKFVDRRIFEKSQKLTKEEKMMKRFAVERRRRYAKEAFNLNHSENDTKLTHYGQNLADLEKLDGQVRSDDDEDYQNDVILPASANFGGDDDDDREPPAKTRKRLIEEMIVKSKQLKQEKQMKREETQNLTEKLDEQWKMVLQENLLNPITSQKTSKNEETSEIFARIADHVTVDQSEKPKSNNATNHRHVTADQSEDYDALVRTLCFDRKRAVAGERLKSDRDRALEERRRLEQYELERQKRMNPLEPGDRSKIDGQSHVNPDESEITTSSAVRRKIDDKSDDDSSDEHLEKRGQLAAFENEAEFECEFASKISNEIASNKSSSETANESSSEFASELPATYDRLKSILSEKSAEDHVTILDRLIKSTHPSLKPGNKQKLEKLFLFLLRYFDECCREMEKVNEKPKFNFNILNALTSFLFKLKDYGREYAGKSVKALLNKHSKTLFPLADSTEMDERKNLHNLIRNKKKLCKFPTFNVFCFLRLVAHLFPTSDYDHPIVTPTFLLMSKILRRSRLRSIDDVIKGLFLCTIFVDYLKTSKKYAPELIEFLRKILTLATTGAESRLLHFGDENLQDAEIRPISIQSIFGSNDRKIDMLPSCLWCAVEICKFLCDFWRESPSWVEIFEPIARILDDLPRDRYPAKLQNQLDEFRRKFEEIRQKLNRSFLTYPNSNFNEENAKKLEFKFHEPRIEENFGAEKIDKGSKVKPRRQLTERERLKRTYKREYKSAVRELKRDNEFLARRQIERNRRVDADRREKTKKLMTSLMGQEADYKKMKRAKDD